MLYDRPFLPPDEPPPVLGVELEVGEEAEETLAAELEGELLVKVAKVVGTTAEELSPQAEELSPQAEDPPLPGLGKNSPAEAVAEMLIELVTGDIELKVVEAPLNSPKPPVETAATELELGPAP